MLVMLNNPLVVRVHFYLSFILILTILCHFFFLTAISFVFPFPSPYVFSFPPTVDTVSIVKHAC